ALGSASITPVDLAAAYATFANGGYAIEPRFIHAIFDDQDRELPLAPWPLVCEDCVTPEPNRGSAEPLTVDTGTPREAPRELDLGLGGSPAVSESGSNSGSAPDSDRDDGPSGSPADLELHGPPLPLLAPRVLSTRTSWLIRSMMSDVVRLGTGRRALALGRRDLAGKTGTSNDQRDTWFSGFNDELVTTVWVGMDSNESLGRLEQGGSTALPIWVDYMEVALDGVPERDAPVPVGIVEASIDPETGLRVRSGTPGALREWFPADNLPPLADPDDLSGDDAKTDPYDIF
ncbi:MAG: hypothetical protein ACPGJE_08325, partial [Wenzhouxiangellaceae bacterium]